MKILITGASGFIGKNIKEYLQYKNEYEIYTPSSKELNCIEEDAVETYLKQHSFDYVLHFAVYGDGIDKTKDRARILDYNLRIFLNFAKSHNRFGKMYYAGSGAEYDKRYPIINVKEDEIGKTVPVDSYGLMKYTVGRIIETSKNLYNFRLFGVFGKYEFYPIKFISNICCKMIKGLPLTIRQDVYFDYLWIGDFCRMIEYFLQNEPQFHTYNMVSGRGIRLEEICKSVRKISQKDNPIYICKDGLGNEYTASNERFIGECEGFCYTPIEEAIKILYHWYEEREEEIDLYKLLY